MNHLTRICVFCGSNAGNRPEYAQAAQDLGREMAHRELGLVYGGGSLGMMGLIARTIDAQGGQVTGVIPELLEPREISGSPIGELIVVNDMHARKATMARMADAFVALPGGFGTLEELFEAITWGQLGIHAKPIGLLNVADYFAPVLQIIANGIEEGFINPSYSNLLAVSSDPADLLDKLAHHRPPRSVLQQLSR
jgi:cytokinin riboside 5'-monophosphate phosphoribohydrolase